MSEHEPPAAKRGRFRIGIWWAWTWFFGASLCNNLLTGVIAVGWTMRFVRYQALNIWANRTGDSSTQSMPPNWFLRENFFESRIEHGLFASIVHSLWHNIRLGALGIFNMWVLTLPSCMLWLFAWYSGWDNSFNKGYEQFWVGPVTGWIGVVIYIAVMLYLPIAFARQSITGNWRTFYNFGLVKKIVQRRRFPLLVLAGMYSLVSVPAFVMRAAPNFIGISEIATMPAEELREWLTNYFLYCSFYVFPAYVVLKTIAGRIYANAVADMLQMGELTIEALDVSERRFLQGLKDGEASTDAALVEQAKGCLGLFMRPGVIILTCLLWLSFVAQIFVAQFVFFDPVVTWLNQPLVQIPTFEYVPSHLKGSARGTEFPVMLAVFWAFCLVRRIIKWRRASGNTDKALD